MRPALDQLAPLELVDDRDHPAGGDVQPFGERVLRLAPARADRPEEGELAGLELQRLQHPRGSRATPRSRGSRAGRRHFGTAVSARRRFAVCARPCAYATATEQFSYRTINRVANEGIGLARQTRSFRLTASVEGHRRLDRPHALRRLRRGPGLEALVPELLDPGQVGLRGEPAHAEDVRHGRPPAGRRRLPHLRRRDEERRRSRLRWRAPPRRCRDSRTSSYFSTHDLMYVSRDRHTTFEEIYPPGPATFSTTSGAAEIRAAAHTGCRRGSRSR